LNRILEFNSIKEMSNDKPIGSGDNTPANNIPVGGGGGGNNIVDPHNLQELTQFIQSLLQQTQDRFLTMSDQIIKRIDEMGRRIDDLEKNINELMTQANIDDPTPMIDNLKP